ncbi:hypothetical protein J7E99_14965 [Streptomyces sp. ISL-44]|uniref:hypothetical protein n=1 Tax=Streptomyces sp. ISL-44 TaxID=2819184 RepID=UPI001BEC4903|nr:hypothetical protein [Streptomyces sp. ISL-44]MBT2541970.1 hypothetical protein [Streptomyces sp. ISL-44]
MRKLKIASALAATTAALGLAIAAPASADGVGAQAVIGTAYSDILFSGDTQDLEDNRPCTAITLTGGAESAQLNLGSVGQVVRLYSTTACTGAPVAVLTSGSAAPVISPAAVAYRSN